MTITDMLISCKALQFALVNEEMASIGVWNVPLHNVQETGCLKQHIVHWSQ